MTEIKEKYLMEMKELSSESLPEEMTNLPKTVALTPESQVNSKENSGKTKTDISDNVLNKKNETELSSDSDDFGMDEGTTKAFTLKDIILGFVNLLCVAVIIFLIIKFPEVSDKVKNERSQMILNDSGFSYELSEISENKAKADEIANKFVDDSGVADFLNEINIIQSSSGLIKKISFGNQKAIDDKATGLIGVPVIIEFSGGLPQILAEVEKIQKLPFVLRTISIDALRDIENPDVISFKFGAFLYLKESIK